VLSLLEQLFRCYGGFGGPSQFIEAGLVSEADYTALKNRLEDEWQTKADENAQQASEIVETARTLGLGPTPMGSGAGQWEARCPGANHSLYINAETESFGCGYCCRKGGSDELRAFHAARQVLSPPHAIIPS
jgi:hypothetical protein